MTAVHMALVLALVTPAAPDPVDGRASDVVARLVDGEPVAALDAVIDDEYRNQVVIEVRDRLIVNFETRDKETDAALSTTFANLIAAALGGQVDGQRQGEALLWAEALWSRYAGDLDDGHAVDLMIGAVLRELGGLAPSMRVGWARRILDRTGVQGLTDAVLGPDGGETIPAWIGGRDWSMGGFLYGVMDAWAIAAATPQDPAEAVAALTPHLDSRLLLDRLLAIQGLKRIGSPAAMAALDALRSDEAKVTMYLTGHTVGTQAGLAAAAAALSRDLGTLRIDLVAAGMDVAGLDRLRWTLLTDLDAQEAAFTAQYNDAARGMRQAWRDVESTAGEVRVRWLGLLRAACRREVDAAPEVGPLAEDSAWRGRAADGCLERLAREAEIQGGTGPVFSREDALAAVGLALKARQRILEDRGTDRIRAYLRAVAEAAYETTQGREEVDGLTAWTMKDPQTAAVVGRIVDVAFERALADGLQEGPERDGAPGLLTEELDRFREAGHPEETVMAVLVGLRWHLLWRDAGRDERSIHQETAWVRFGARYWERHRDLRDRMRVEAYAREITEDLARDDEDVATLRWALAPEDRPLLERIRRDLEQARAASAKAARRTGGVPEEALDLFLEHYPVLDEIAMIWLAACYGETPKTPAPAGFAAPEPKADPMDLRRVHRPQSAYTDVVHRNFGKFRDCYAERLKRRPGLKGTLVVAVEVSTMDKVSVRMVHDTLRDDELSKCVLRAMRRLDFPVPKDKVHIFEVPIELYN